MVSFFIIISLILNFVALFGIIIVYMRQNRLFDLEKKQDKAVKEMEEVISSYLLEMKEDNEEFLKKIKLMNSSKNYKDNIQGEMNEDTDQLTPKVLVPKQNEENLYELPIKPIQVARSHAVKAYKKDQFEKDEFTEIQTDHIDENSTHNKTILEEIILLQNQGFSEEEIAKKLNKGKTEIQLLLKFRQNV